MIKKKLGLAVTSALFFGLVACNNNAALDTDNNENGTFNVSDNVNYNGRGPLARDLNTRDRNDANDLGIDLRDDENDITDNNVDFLSERNNNGLGNMDISSSKTEISSKNYPHTRAIAIQDAKFKFIQADNMQEAQQKAQAFINQQRQRAQQYAQGAQPRAQQQNQQQQNQQQQNQQQQNQQQAPVEQGNQQQAQNQAPAQQQQAAPAEKDAQQPTQGISQAAQQVIDLTNAERRRNGLPDLKGDAKLSGVAQKKSEDMRQNNYFSHTSPTYGSPFDMMRDFGVTYKTAGENIAQGQQTPQQVVQAWMNSEGHRRNILNKDFTHIGVGYDQNGHHWTQMFIGK